jgi:hypothetical protein
VTADLPGNPWTITYVARHPRTASDVEKKYVQFGRHANNAAIFKEVRRDLAEIRLWDIYDGHTNEAREGAKAALRRILDREP